MVSFDFYISDVSDFVSESDTCSDKESLPFVQFVAFVVRQLPNGTSIYKSRLPWILMFVARLRYNYLELNSCLRSSHWITASFAAYQIFSLTHTWTIVVVSGTGTYGTGTEGCGKRRKRCSISIITDIPPVDRVPY
jgi:hypothetical protein